MPNTKIILKPLYLLPEVIVKSKSMSVDALSNFILDTYDSEPGSIRELVWGQLRSKSDNGGLLIPLCFSYTLEVANSCLTYNEKTLKNSYIEVNLDRD